MQITYRRFHDKLAELQDHVYMSTGAKMSYKT
jgi:hypothetical protein